MNDKMFGGQTRQGIETAATLGWVLYQMDNITQADQVMQAIVQTGSPSADSLYYRAMILEKVGKTEDAIKYLKAAVAVSPSFVHRREAKAMLAKLGGDVPEDKSKEKKSKETSDTEPPKTGNRPRRFRRYRHQRQEEAGTALAEVIVPRSPAPGLPPGAFFARCIKKIMVGRSVVYHDLYPETERPS